MNPERGAWLEEHRGRILRRMSHLVGPEDAQDLTQVAMIRIREKICNFRGESALTTWIYRLATNVALDHLRRRRAAPPTADVECLDSAELPEELREPSAESTAERREMSRCVREFVERLPQSYRSIVVLAEIEGLTNAEIAEVTGLSLETVKIRLHRGRERLRGALREGCSLRPGGESGISCERRMPEAGR